MSGFGLWALSAAPVLAALQGGSDGGPLAKRALCAARELGCALSLRFFHSSASGLVMLGGVAGFDFIGLVRGLCARLRTSKTRLGRPLWDDSSACISTDFGPRIHLFVALARS